MQQLLTLKPRARGFHLITDEVTSQLAIPSAAGLLHLFLQHTSASLTLNENADPDVRTDMESYFARAVADDISYFKHTLEGPDDMTAHIKSSLLGNSLQIPVYSEGQLLLGLWQGIWLGEHRIDAGSRRIVATFVSCNT